MGGPKDVVSWVGMVKAYPADLAVLCISTIVAAVGVEVLSPGSSLRFLLVAPLAFLWPGYALVTFLFPVNADSAFAGDRGVVARIALAFATSLALVPLTIVAVGTVAPLTVTYIVESLVIFTLVVAQLAAIRRIRRPATGQYRSSHRFGLDRAASKFAGRSSLTSKVSGLLLVGAVLVAASTAGMALAHPPDDNDFRNFHLATEDADGELQTAGYPTNLTTGSSASLVTIVSNEEEVERDYHVVVQLQRVDDGTVVERSELTRFSNTTEAGDQWRHNHEVTPDMAGEELRLKYLLYRGDVPDQPSVGNAADHLHLWLDVSSATR